LKGGGGEPYLVLRVSSLTWSDGAAFVFKKKNKNKRRKFLI